MSVTTLLVLLALAATAFCLVSGICAMATHGEVGHRSSHAWMFRRVGFQAVALLLLILAMAAD